MKNTVFAAVLGLLASATLPSWEAVAQDQGPLTLASQGSFFVGGTDKLTDALSTTSKGSGTISVDQMYVQYQVPTHVGRQRTSVIMLHGCCLTAKSFETTPDGRMGWNEYFVRRGYPTYLPDQVSRGRSGFDATMIYEAAQGIKKDGQYVPNLYTIGHESAYTSFRFGPSLNSPYPNEQFPVAYVEEFYKQMVPDFNGLINPGYPPTPNPTYNNLSALAIQLGGAVIVGHSESGFFPENAALVSTSNIRGMVSLEPGGSCTTANPSTIPLTNQQFKTLATIPTLIIYGDNLNGSWLKSYASCQAYAKRIRSLGGDVTFVHLPESGIRGNSHMMMLDKNNLKVADVILTWIEQHVDNQNRPR